MLENLQAIGLIYDAVGIAILGLPAIYRAVQEIAAQSGTYFDFNPPLTDALAKSRVDITVGSITILFGFLLQLLSIMNFCVPKMIGGLLIAISLLGILLYWLWGRSIISKWLLKKVHEERERIKQEREKERAHKAGRSTNA